MMKKSLLLGCSLAILIGCGEETTGAKHNPRSDSPTAHSNEITAIATELAKQSIATNNAPMDFSEALNSATSSLSKETVSYSENIDVDIDGNCGGSMGMKGKVFVAEDPDASTQMSADLKMSYNDFCVASFEYETTLDGNVDTEMTVYNDNKMDMSMDYDLSFESDDPAIPSGYITLSMDCSMDFGDLSSGNDAAFLAGCSISTSYVAPNGQTYSIKDLEVTSDADGVNMSGEFSGKEGTFDYTAEDLTLCDNGNIGSGTITLEDKDSGDTVEVEYISCDEYTVTEDGETTTHEQ